MNGYLYKLHSHLKFKK